MESVAQNEPDVPVVVAPDNGEGSGASAVTAALPKKNAAPSAFRGVIGDMSGDIVYIDQGTASGLTVGDMLTILRENGDVVINGQVVGKKEQAIGKVKVVEVLEKYSVGKILEKTAEVKQGDTVKRSVD